LKYNYELLVFLLNKFTRKRIDAPPCGQWKAGRKLHGIAGAGRVTLIDFEMKKN
jgi:hypothetical protein